MYINGYAISGAASVDVLRELIQEQLDAQEGKAANASSKPQAKAESATLVASGAGSHN